MQQNAFQEKHALPMHSLEPFTRRRTPSCAYRCEFMVSAVVAGLLLPCGVATAELPWVERPDPMQVHMLADADRKGDTVRVLYQSMPSLAQAASGDWTVNVYVAELHPDGRIENRKLASGQRHYSSLVLQRGGEGVFATITPERRASEVTFEFWSALDGSLISTFTSPDLVSLGSALNVFPTDDGNFFTVEHSAQTSEGERPTTLTWTKMSPAGEVLAKGQWSNPTAITGLGGTFPVPGGGMGISLDMRLAKGADALQTDIEAVQPFEIGGRAIEARVFSETRLLTAEVSGAFRWLSPALERDLMWTGEMSIPQDLPIDQMMAQNAEQMALMRRVTLENGGERRIVHQATVGYDDVQATPEGYGVLARVSADRSLNPPQHGTWFIEVGRDGTLNRELRIEAAAERLKAKLERFLPTGDGGLLVAGPRYEGETNVHLTFIDQAGHARWTTEVGAKGLQLEGLSGSDKSPWVFGQGWSEARNKSLMWAELVDPGSAEAMPAASAQAPTAATPQPRPRAASPETASPPTLDLPEPAEGCVCSCEEFAAIRELTEQMKSIPQAEMLAIVSDPSFQARMNCMGGCAMQYAQCQ
jgi:hypothetical protein